MEQNKIKNWTCIKLKQMNMKLVDKPQYTAKLILKFLSNSDMENFQSFSA